MKVVLIEDEIPAREKLRKLLSGFKMDIEVVQELASIRESLQWFGSHEQPDLIFMDIELSDGLSFDLIEKAHLTCPIIFITAFDEYWQEAFEHNSIDYLLKPLKKERLQIALNKFSEIKDYFASRYQNLLSYQTVEKQFKDRFLVRRGKEFASIKSENIALFYATHKLVCLLEKNGAKYILDSSLSEIEKQVDPKFFFRANRKYLVHISSIGKIHSLPKSKLLVEVIPEAPDELIISSENSSAFKTWMSS
jgi:DNA-binding LytR/AlgR family response regulator